MRPSHGTTAFNRVWKIMTSILIYFSLFYIFIFWGRQERCPCSYASSSAMRNSDLCSSLKAIKLCVELILNFSEVHFNQQKWKRPLRQWTLNGFKRFLWIKAWLCVDFNFGFTYLLSNSLKDDLWSKWLVETYFTMIEWDYSANDRLKLYFTMIKWDYDTNDRLKFYFTMIKWDYDTNDRSRLALHREMRPLMVEEWRWKRKWNMKQKRKWTEM